MASAEHEPLTGVWGCAPSGIQGQSPGQGAKLNTLLWCDMPETVQSMFMSCLWSLTTATAGASIM